MIKLPAALAALAIAALPLVTHAGAASCPDYTGDGRVTTADILYVIDNYQGPKEGGGVFSVIDLLETVQHYGEACA
jgi:hypothetical protein